ncbi:group II intron reverse transcriptase/maturase [Priestia megaterium]|uniref:group II intron reverse transcriptase/maturase n=1 Tax=Priestia megaterium TaxID=1404 RepID=UPI0030DAA531
MNSIKKNKRKKLRFNEYYDMQQTYDNLYAGSKRDRVFKNLVPIITAEENIKLAFRNIKSRKGSKTPGVNGHTITDLEKFTESELIKYVQNRIENFTPHMVRRKLIPKNDRSGKKRPLGIPSIEDRLLQQCILQVMEPICEAKFYPYSYGFRPNRNQHHAMAKVHFLVNMQGLHHVVDIDIEGFFDNVNHSKLLKQIWTMGIRDKNLIRIISKLIKAEIEGEGVPNKGTPQGGILSPLLSNIVLNELDWWISSQWENFPTKHTYKGTLGSNRFKALKDQTNLKECYIVRFADDLKIFCPNHHTAKKVSIATVKWLGERLGLKANPEKSQIINLKQKHSNFLGFTFKVRRKGKTKKGYVIESNISPKAAKNIRETLMDGIKNVQRLKTVAAINKLNSIIIGQHNYYKIATNVAEDFSKIAFSVRNAMYNRLRSWTQIIKANEHQKRQKVKRYGTYNKYYKEYKGKLYAKNYVPVLPISYVKFAKPMMFSQDICNYTVIGRAKVHENLKKVNLSVLAYIMKNPITNSTVLYNDNRISLYVGQAGLCGISKQSLEIGSMECHHIIPLRRGGTNEYKNLIWVTKDVHKLIHATREETILKYIALLNLNQQSLKKLNKFRKTAGNSVIKLKELLSEPA